MNRKFYIATKLDNLDEHNILRDFLVEKLSDSISFDWTELVKNNDKNYELDEIAALEHAGVVDADYVIIILPGGRGAHVEMGMSLALNKQTILIAHDREAQWLDTCGFYHHSDVQRFRSINEFIDSVSNLIK